MTIQDIYFDVKIHKTATLFNTPFAPHISHCVVRQDTRMVLHTCTASYNLVSNKSLTAPIYNVLIRRYGSSGFSTEVISYDDTKFFVRFLINDRSKKIQPEDELLPCIEIGNSYNGKLKSFVKMGFYRMLSGHSLKAYAFNFSERQMPTEYHGSEDSFLEHGFEEYDQKIKHFQQLNKRQLTKKKLHTFKEDISAMKVFPNTLLDRVFESLDQEANRYNFKRTPWLLYNAFNRVLFEADFKMHLDERIKRDVRISKLVEAFA